MINSQLTQDALKKFLFYNPKTGIWIWKVDMKLGQIKKGSVAGSIYGTEKAVHMNI